MTWSDVNGISYRNRIFEKKTLTFKLTDSKTKCKAGFCGKPCVNQKLNAAVTPLTPCVYRNQIKARRLRLIYVIKLAYNNQDEMT